ncbi:MAG: ATPase, T2SS/T4P/T4SS family [Nanoarchaeota archaeon]
MRLFKKKEVKAEDPSQHLASLATKGKAAGTAPNSPPASGAPRPTLHLPSIFAHKEKAAASAIPSPASAPAAHPLTPSTPPAEKKTQAEEKPKFSLFKKPAAGPQKPKLSFGKKPEKAEAPKPILVTPRTEYEVTKPIDTYTFFSKNIPITIRVFRAKHEYVPIYEVSISAISKTTDIILEKIRDEIIRQVNLGMIDITASKKSESIEEKFEDAITTLIDKFFPDIDDKTRGLLTTHLIQRSLGMGKIEILMDDQQLEEVAVNSAEEPVWVYHRVHGWLKTNIFLRDEDQTKQYATMIARKVGRQVTVLSPLLDAHLKEGDRVNATLIPISTRGNTMTMRKFSRDPWTITKFIRSKTMSSEAAALIWLGIQYELSMLICGGTASGKTSMLNVATNFFPPNQRIISIEDTREIQLPSFLHWVPMSTRMPNPEGKGEISMLDLLVNSLRMRPDRIVVGEVRRQREAEVLFEAIHTGHSVYATFHANSAHEAITRLTNPPIDVPKVMLPAISMLVVQFRNRRTGLRRTFQIAEITEDGNQRTLLQFDNKLDALVKVARSKELMDTLLLYTGYSSQEIDKILLEKQAVLKYLVRHKVDSVEDVGHAMAQYYTNYEEFMKLVMANKPMR